MSAISQLIVNGKFRGTTRIVINGAVPANGTILYVANGVICAVNPPADGTNKALCMADNVPAWQTITVGGSGVLEATIPKIQAVMFSSAWQQNAMQESGGVAGDLTIDMNGDYPLLSALLTTVNTFVDNFKTHVKYNW